MSMANPQAPLVSICIPTYNGARHLGKCLDSISSQSFGNLEILVVDDQSSDESLSIAREYARSDPRVRVEQNERRVGLARNWNRCITLAHGEWIKFLFQDDVLEPLCVENMLRVSGPGSLLIVCRRHIAFENVDGETRKEYARYLNEESIEGIFAGEVQVSPRKFSEAVLDHLGMNFVGEPSAVLLHRSVFSMFGEFNPDFVEIPDLEYWTRIGIHVGLTYVPETLATFRVHASGTSAVNRREQQYRREFLDQAILLHEFVFHPAFAPLRAAAAEREPAVDLQGKFVTLALQARRRARDGKDAMNQWQALVRHYPRLERSYDVKWQGFRSAIARRIRGRIS